MDFDQLLEQEVEYDEPRYKWPTRTLQHVKAAKNCPYCHLTLQALLLDDKNRYDDHEIFVCCGEPTLVGFVDDFDPPQWQRLIARGKTLIDLKTGAELKIPARPSERQILRPRVRFAFFLCSIDSVVGVNKDSPGTGTWIIDRKAEDLALHSIQKYTTNLTDTVEQCDIADENLLLGRPYEDLIDFERLKNWLTLTQSVQPERGEYFKKYDIILLNLETMSLVQGSSSMSYAVLSYVWGRTAQVQLKKENVERFFQANSIAEILDILPRTIRDAIHATKSLGIPYLWCDSLCIVQDDETVKANQIGNMLSIYTSAVLTLVNASSGDEINAHTPLPGVFPGSRTIRQKFAGQLLLTERKSMHHCIRSSKWYSRGWTFQEFLGSGTILYFTDHQVFLHCPSRFFCEDTVFEHPNPSIAPTIYYSLNCETFDQPLWSTEQNADLDYLGSCLANYSKRCLSFKADTLLAIESLLETYFTPFVDGLHNEFLVGMPSCAFDFMMCWNFTWSDTVDRNILFPSWSWAGWGGEKTFGIGNYHTQSADGTKEVVSPYVYTNSMINPDTDVYSTVRDHFGFPVVPFAVAPHNGASSLALNFITSTLKLGVKRVNEKDDLRILPDNQRNFVELELYYPSGDHVKQHTAMSEPRVTIRLPSKWYNSQLCDRRSTMDFITIRTAPTILAYDIPSVFGPKKTLADYKEGNPVEWPVWLMCVEFKDHTSSVMEAQEMEHVAERIAVTSWPTSLKEWVDQGAKECCITLV